jgi:RimJ/RimL family protein N-acetyltransferase
MADSCLGNKARGLKNMKPYQGTTVYFRLVDLSDAEFILNLRLDPKNSVNLSPTDSSLDKQIAWLQGYKEREAVGQEFYYIIHRRDNDLPIGTIRIYDFDIRKSSFCWGSWILNSDKTISAALESCIFIFDKGFYEFGFYHNHGNIVKTNTKVIRFHKKLSIAIVDEDERLVYNSYPRQVYEQNRDRFLELIRLSAEIG